jgi:hypothetical protein
MSRHRSSRGDGVGLELTHNVVRGVALGNVPGRLTRAAEVRIDALRDDRAVLDALVRVRAELGGPNAPTRVALFPAGSTMHRVDVTGLTGPELNSLRNTLESTHHISSTVLIDDGPRRWMLALRWDEAFALRIEELIERAGFLDVALDPSPVALARTLPPGTTFARRDATTDEAFDMVVQSIPVAAGSIEPVGRSTPGLTLRRGDVEMTVFDELDDPVDIAAQLGRSFARAADGGPAEWSLQLATDDYPPYPEHDIRSPARQCVALGAALGAAGLAGRIRPIDMTVPLAIDEGANERPWAIERVSALPPKEIPRPVTPAKRLVGRVIPRRRR